jgi:predicted HTH transcriptional regulator
MSNFLCKGIGNFLQIIFKRPKSEWRKNGEKMPVATQESTIIDHLKKHAIIDHLKKHAHITSIEVKEMFHVQDSRARKILSIMAEKGILKKQGKTKSTYYILN